MIMLSFTAKTPLIDVQGADNSLPEPAEIKLSPELKEKLGKVARSTVRKNVTMCIFMVMYDMLATLYYPSIDLTCYLPVAECPMLEHSPVYVMILN